MTAKKLSKIPSKKLTKKELETKRLRKKYIELGYDKHMPFGNFRKLCTSVNVTWKA
jgi:hypothetical protein